MIIIQTPSAQVTPNSICIAPKVFNGDKVKFKGGKEEEIENYITRKHCFLDEGIDFECKKCSHVHIGNLHIE
jgi:hypothetical protein